MKIQYWKVYTFNEELLQNLIWIYSVNLSFTITNDIQEDLNLSFWNHMIKLGEVYSFIG